MYEKRKRPNSKLYRSAVRRDRLIVTALLRRTAKGIIRYTKNWKAANPTARRPGEEARKATTRSKGLQQKNYFEVAHKII